MGSSVFASQKERLELHETLKASDYDVSLSMIDAFLKLCIALKTISKDKFVFRLGIGQKEGKAGASEATVGDEKDQEVVVMSQPTRSNFCRCKNPRESDKLICYKKCGCVRGKTACSELCGCFKLCAGKQEVRCATKVDNVIQRVVLEDGSILSDQKNTDKEVQVEERKESLTSTSLMNSVKLLEKRVTALEDFVRKPEMKQVGDATRGRIPTKTTAKTDTVIERTAPQLTADIRSRDNPRTAPNAWIQVSRRESRENRERWNYVRPSDSNDRNNKAVQPILVIYNYPIYQERIPLSRHVEMFCADMKMLDACDVGAIRAARGRTGLVYIWAPTDISSKILTRKSALSRINSRIGFRRYIPIEERRKQGEPKISKTSPRVATPDAGARQPATAAQRTAASDREIGGRAETYRQENMGRWSWRQVQKPLTPQRESSQVPVRGNK
ncbi:MAG: hypothetical protein ACK5XN_10690 [Bacteroidota bacterium]